MSEPIETLLQSPISHALWLCEDEAHARSQFMEIISYSPDLVVDLLKPSRIENPDQKYILVATDDWMLEHGVDTVRKTDMRDLGYRFDLIVFAREGRRDPETIKALMSVVPHWISSYHRYLVLNPPGRSAFADGLKVFFDALQAK